MYFMLYPDLRKYHLTLWNNFLANTKGVAESMIFFFFLKKKNDDDALLRISSYTASCLYHRNFGSCDRNREVFFGFKNIVDNICQRKNHRNN
jgi:hypothetical protein